MARSAKDVLILEQRAQCWSMGRGWNTLWPSQAPTAPPRRGPPRPQSVRLGQNFDSRQPLLRFFKDFFKMAIVSFMTMATRDLPARVC